MPDELVCSYDDVDQIYFSENHNIRYGSVQSSKRFGFEDVDTSVLTAAEVDHLLTSLRTSISPEKKDLILNFLFDESSLNKLEVIMEHGMTAKVGFGLPNFAIVVDTASVWLVNRGFEFSENDHLTDMIQSLSSRFGLFLIDSEKGFVIESSVRHHLIDYLTYEEYE